MSQSNIIAQLIGLQLPLASPDLLDENTDLITSLRDSKNISGTKFASPLVRSIEEEVEISSWIAWARKVIQTEDADKLELILVYKSYLVGHRPSVADVAVFVALHQSEFFSPNRVNLCRWAIHIEKLVNGGLLPPLGFSSIGKIVPLPLPVSAQQSEPVTASPAEVKSEEKLTTTAPQQPESNSNKQPTSKQQSGGGKEKEGKKVDKKEAAATASTEDETASSGSQPEPGRLDIRVGQVIRCWNHAESDKLLCEEIDLGEGKSILSL